MLQYCIAKTHQIILNVKIGNVTNTFDQVYHI